MKWPAGVLAFALFAVIVFSVVPPPTRAPAPEEPVLTQERDSMVENYVRTNISLLSPEAAVLGGTYYVTAVHAAGGTGVVSYEDGHVAYTADFTYVKEGGGNITVTSFVIRE